LKKLIVDKFHHAFPFLWIFPKTFQNKMFGLPTHRLALRKIYIFIDNLHQIFFCPDLEGHSSVEQLIRQYTNIPNIYFVVVLLFLDYFRGGVKGRSAAGVSEEWRVDGPSEIANFDDTLNKMEGTSCSNMFYGLMSRWIMSLSCMNSRAWQVCFMICLTFYSEKRFSRRRML
jgi:hypothetical protein